MITRNLRPVWNAEWYSASFHSKSLYKDSSAPPRARERAYKTEVTIKNTEEMDRARIFQQGNAVGCDWPCFFVDKTSRRLRGQGLQLTSEWLGSTEDPLTAITSLLVHLQGALPCILTVTAVSYDCPCTLSLRVFVTGLVVLGSISYYCLSISSTRDHSRWPFLSLSPETTAWKKGQKDFKSYRT